MKPGFALAVVTTLALGIGANAAKFGIVDRMLFRAPNLMKDPATRIPFTTFRTGNAQVFVMNADGSAASNVSNSPFADRAGFPQAWR